MRLIKWPFLFTICLFCFQIIFGQETERYYEYNTSEFVDIDESDEEIASEISLLKARLNINYTNNLVFSHESGYYDDSFDLNIEAEAESKHSIYYTLDGSIPTHHSHRYQEESPIEITLDTILPFSATVIRARSYSDTIATSQIISKTYLVHPEMKERFSFPVISLITDPDNFFDHEIGIYVKGINHDPNNSTWSGNWFMTGIEWERDVHIQYFTTSGEIKLDQAAGVRIHGGLQRNAAQKSLRLYARSEYGQKVFNYRLLPQKEKTEYKRFILRTSYGCWNHTVIKDPMAASLVRELNFDVQDYRPVIVLLNGDYWGIQTIRDYQGTHHLAEKYNLNKDSVNIGQDETAYEGSSEKYLGLEKILDSMDLSASKTMLEIEKKLDISSTINYYNTEIYLNNYDWPAGNRRWWNTNEYDDGKMHWLLFDLDASFSARGGVSHNSLKQATVPSDSWPNPPSRTKLISSLLKNQTFKNEFITRAAYLMNYSLHADTINPVIYSIKAENAPEMQEHIKRWNFRTYDSWEEIIESALVNFARDRRENVNQHYIS
ncbi:MAG: CotH kinase family protein, partial [Bacteroides sp.]|nr:CotH kinase family protein [Bacteroides sp.]